MSQLVDPDLIKLTILGQLPKRLKYVSLVSGRLLLIDVLNRIQLVLNRNLLPVGISTRETIEQTGLIKRGFIYITSEALQWPVRYITTSYFQRNLHLDEKTHGLTLTSDLMQRRVLGSPILPPVNIATVIPNRDTLRVHNVSIPSHVDLPADFKWEIVEGYDRLDVVRSTNPENCHRIWTNYPQLGFDWKTLNLPIVKLFYNYWSHRKISTDLLMSELHKSNFDLTALHVAYQGKYANALINRTAQFGASSLAALVAQVTSPGWS
jgi:hypothetical protein